MFNIGDSVKCVLGTTGLTLGKIYIVLDPIEHLKVHGFKPTMINYTTVLDDTNEINGWCNYCFESIIPFIDYLNITRSICGG